MHARWCFVAGLATGLLAGCGNFPQMPGREVKALNDPPSVAGSKLPANDSVLAMMVHGKLGQSHGMLVAAEWSKIEENQGVQALNAAKQARAHPARPADVHNSSTADLNGDGFVTLDEIVAMQKSGLSQEQVVNRLERTFYHYELTPWQRNYLRNQGVTRAVLAAIVHIPVDNARTASVDLGPVR